MGRQKRLPEGRGIESLAEADAGSVASQRGSLTLERKSTVISEMEVNPSVVC